MSAAAKSQQRMTDEPDGQHHCQAEKRHPRKERHVPDVDHAGLVATPPASSVVDRRRHEQCRCRERREEAAIEEDAVLPRNGIEPRCKRDRQKEREEELRPRKSDAQLVEELDQLSVRPLLGALTRGGLRVRPELPGSTGFKLGCRGSAHGIRRNQRLARPRRASGRRTWRRRVRRAPRRRRPRSFV